MPVPRDKNVNINPQRMKITKSLTFPFEQVLIHLIPVDIKLRPSIKARVTMMKGEKRKVIEIYAHSIDQMMDTIKHQLASN